MLCYPHNNNKIWQKLVFTSLEEIDDDFDGDDDDQRDDERWPPGAGLLSPPFEAQIIQSLAGKKATFMRHSATVQRQKLLRRDDFYGVQNNTLLDRTFAAQSDQSFFWHKTGIIAQYRIVWHYDTLALWHYGSALKALL